MIQPDSSYNEGALPGINSKKVVINSLSNELFDNLPVAIYTCNRQGQITSYNHAATVLWGREPEMGKDLWCGSWKIYSPDGSILPLDLCPMAKTLKEGVAILNEEIIIERPDGTKRNIMPYPAPTFDQSGNLIGAINTLIDITEERQNETKQAMLASIIHSSEDAIISKTLKGMITSWNHAAERLFGYTEQEVLGKHISILIPLERLNEEDLIIEKIRSNQSIDHFETIRVNKNGKEIPISLTVSPIRNTKGQIIGASKIARDITRQREADNLLLQYANSLEILNSVGRVVAADLDINSILQKVTDATTKLTGAAFGAFFHNQLDEKGESYMLYTLSGAPKEAFEKFGMPRNTAVFNATFGGEGVVRVDDITKDPRYGKSAPYYGMPKGHLPVVSYLAVPVVSKSGAVIGGLFFGHPDPGKFSAEHEHLVSAIAVQAAVSLDNAKLYEEIKALNSKKDEFIGLASHELKTPVTSISAFLQLIDRNLPEENSNKELISKARSQVGKLASLIADLLDVSKIQTGKLPFSFTSFNLIELLSDVIEVMQQTNTSHKIALSYTDDPMTVCADLQRIEQVVINLISNAVKYSANANHIIVHAALSGNKIKVSVQDFGIGLEQIQQERIFSRFYRVESSSSHPSGLGIGLYISHEIIDRHKGRLWVKSIPGEGATFFFEIPVNQQTED